MGEFARPVLLPKGIYLLTDNSRWDHQETKEGCPVGDNSTRKRNVIIDIVSCSVEVVCGGTNWRVGAVIGMKPLIGIPCMP